MRKVKALFAAQSSVHYLNIVCIVTYIVLQDPIIWVSLDDPAIPRSTWRSSGTWTKRP